MSDLISMQKAIDEIRFYITEPNIFDNETKIEGYNNGLEMAIFILSILSSTESEQKKGKWLEREVFNDVDDAIIHKWQTAKCSVCGKYHTAPYIYIYISLYRFFILPKLWSKNRK